MDKISKRILKITILSIILILIETTSYARYINTEVVKVKPKIVKPILNMKEGIPIKIDNENRTKSYEFSIENFKDNDVSEIGFWYTIQIVSSINLESNFNIRLYNEEGEIQLSNLKTNPILIKGNERIEQKYKIYIECNESEEEEDYRERELENISGIIQIRVSAEQEKI